MENISDYALVQESLKGNEDSFSELVRRYKNLVLPQSIRYWAITKKVWTYHKKYL